MIMNIVVIRTEIGMYEVTYNTETANTILFDGQLKVTLSIGIAILDFILILISLYDISQ
jgi:hypothetical protein